jgi:hypothetical protein
MHSLTYIFGAEQREHSAVLERDAVRSPQQQHRSRLANSQIGTPPDVLVCSTDKQNVMILIAVDYQRRFAVDRRNDVRGVALAAATTRAGLARAMTRSGRQTGRQTDLPPQAT